MSVFVGAGEITAAYLGATALSAIYVGATQVWPVAAAPLWTPADIQADLALWLDADDAATISEVGGSISVWTDKSSAAHALSQTNASFQPVYNAMASRVEFSGQFLSAAVSGHPAVASYAMVVRPAGNERILGGAAGAGSFRHQFETNAGVWRLRNTVNDPSSLSNTGAMVIAEGVFNGASSLIRINGGAPETLNPGAPGSPPEIWVGATVSDLFMAVDLHIHEVIGFDGVWPQATRETVEGYLAHKWGLTANLPAAHPYKASAP